MRVEGRVRYADENLHRAEKISVLPPFSALAEIVILFALIYGAEQLTPNLSILDLSPHPFWIPVLLVSLQYGTVSGFIAAGAAIGLSLFTGFPEQDIGENLFVYFLRVFGQPILWIGVALLVGQFRMRQLGAKEELRIANQMLSGQRDDLAFHAQKLRDRIERLEQELATRYGAPPHAIAAVLAQTMAAGGFIDEKACQSTLQRAAIALFPEAVITVYRLRDGILCEYAVCGRQLKSGPRMRVSAEAPLYAKVIGEGRCVSVLDAGGEDVLAGTGLAAVPIAAASSNPVSDTNLIPSPHSASNVAVDGSAKSRSVPDMQRPFGMLVIEQERPDTITPEGILALQLLAHALQPRQPLATLRPQPCTRPMPRRARMQVGAGLNEAARTARPARIAHDPGDSLLVRLSKASGSADAIGDVGDVRAAMLITMPGGPDCGAMLRDEECATADGEREASSKP